MSKKLTTVEILKKFKKEHGNKYDYSKVNYVNNRTKICIVCPIHGKFFQSPYCHYNRKQECPICGNNNKTRNKLVLNKNEFINKANIIHKNKYDYSKFIYINALTNGIIICPIHNEFLQCPNNHINMNNGCPKCGINKQKLSMIYSNYEYIQKVKLIHNNIYDYSKINYENSHKKICIICKKHGEFFQTPNSHLNGNGCPKCIHIVSNPEMEFLNYLNIFDINKNRQKHIKPYKVDGYDPITNTIYEFLGDYWHGNPLIFNSKDYNKTCHKMFGELYENTNKKFNKLKSLGYNVKYIWESDWKKYKNNTNIKPKIVTY